MITENAINIIQVDNIPLSKADAIAVETNLKGPWGLIKEFDLRVELVNFYLYMALTMMAEARTEIGYQMYRRDGLPLLEQQFRSYTDMAVGGELRHALSKNKGAFNDIPLALKNAMKSNKLRNGDSRKLAWNDWFVLRQQWGTKALDWAVEVFSAFKSGAYGGKKWANIANTLLMYEQRKTTQVTFIDTCWSLQHNGGMYFNKIWSQYITGLHSLLEAGKNTNINVLLAHRGGNDLTKDLKGAYQRNITFYRASHPGFGTGSNGA
jgi:hypothetical protein